MARRIHRALLMTGGLVTLFSTWTIDAQTVRRIGLHPETVAQSTCELGTCQPRTLSYGYYRENWRRWPEEPSTPTVTNSLSPYAKPILDHLAVPKSAVPDPRDEASANQRHRSGSGPSVVTPPNAAPAITPSAPAPSGNGAALPEPSPTRIPLGGPSSDVESALEPTEPLPSLPDEAEPATRAPAETNEAPKEDAPFFPSAEETPESAPETGIESNEAAPPAEQPGSSEEAPEDLFDDLPDLGQSNHERIRRYRNERTSQYRSADDSRAVARTKSRKPAGSQSVARSQSSNRRPGRAEGSPAVQPASYHESPASRSNPLRAGKLSAKPAVQRYDDEEDRSNSSARRPAPRREIEPVEFLEYEDGEEAEFEYEAEAPVEKPRRDSSRSRSRGQSDDASAHNSMPRAAGSNVAFTDKDTQQNQISGSSHDNPLRLR